MNSMELRGVRLIGKHDEFRVSSGRIMAAYKDRRQTDNETPSESKMRPRRRTPESVKAIHPQQRWVVSGFFLIASNEVKRWSGSTELVFRVDDLEFHVVSLSKWTSSPTGFETWNFRALCMPSETQLELLPVTTRSRASAETNPAFKEA